jgi:hypothetical protein
MLAGHTTPLELAQDELYENTKHGKKHRFSGELSELFCVDSELLEDGKMRVEKAFVLADELQDRIGFKYDIAAKGEILSDIKESLENQKELCQKVAEEWDEEVVEEFRAEIRAEIGVGQEGGEESDEDIEEEVAEQMEKFV